MNCKLAIFIFLIAFSCKMKGPENVILTKSTLGISCHNDIIFYLNEKFNGTLFEIGGNNQDTILLENYKNGLLNGRFYKRYPNNQLMEVREYTQGRKNGKQIAYWENGNKRFEFIAKDDAYEGEMKEWTQDGKLFHWAHFKNGQEEGKQKLWYENGKIRANYVIINGKRYGLLGTKNCKNVSDSIIVVK